MGCTTPPNASKELTPELRRALWEATLDEFVGAFSRSRAYGQREQREQPGTHCQQAPIQPLRIAHAHVGRKILEPVQVGIPLVDPSVTSLKKVDIASMNALPKV